MIIYIAALLWIVLMDIRDNKGRLSFDSPQVITKRRAHLAIAFLVFFIGLRDAGADTHAYIRNYVFFTESGMGKALRTLFSFKDECLFGAYGIFMKTIFGDNYTPYLFGIAAIIGLVVSDVLRKESEAYYTSLILFMLMGMWTWMFNGIRQFLAVALSFACLPLIEKKQTFKYIICILIISRIHFSVVMLIAAYFLVRGEPWRVKTLLMLLGVLFAVLFTNSFNDVLEVATAGTTYGNIVTDIYYLRDTGSNPLRTVIYAVPPILAFVNRKYIEKNAPELIKICINMSIICVGVSAIANVTSGVYIGRLPIYYAVYNLILLPWLFIHVYRENKKAWTKRIMAFYSLYYIFMFCYYARPYYSSSVLHLFLR